MKGTIRSIATFMFVFCILASGCQLTWAGETVGNGAEQSSAQPAAAAPASPDTKKENEARIGWWRDARVGMFIHWGLYAIPARGEWVQWDEQIPNEEYAKLADQFKPTHFDPDQWAATAKAAGAKYVVFTSRHHDGFSMYDSKASNYTSKKTAAHRDFVAEYTKAVRKAGLRVGLYYSPLDWRFPGYIAPDIYLKSAEAMREQYHRQVKELLSKYGKIDILWFDGGETDWLSFGSSWKGGLLHKRPKVDGKYTEHYTGRFSWKHQDVFASLRALQPQVVINNRANMPDDFFSREGEAALGDYDAEHPWELCITLAGPWGWKPDAEVKPLRDIIHFLAGAVGRDGNFMLNVGPRPDGQIDPPQVQRMREVGDWLNKYGESIYSTRGGPFLPGEYGVSTRRGNAVYVHVLKWSQDKVLLPAIPAKVVRASVLGGGVADVRQSADGVELSVPAANRSDIDTVIKLELDQSAASLAPVAVASK